MRAIKPHNRQNSLSEKITFDKQVKEISEIFEICDSERSRQLAFQRLEVELEYEQLAIDKAMKNLGIRNDGTLI